MNRQQIGYARCSTYSQDLTAQRQALLELGVQEDRVYTDHGLSGTKRDRPGLEQALAAVREGDTLVVTKLDRLAQFVPDLRKIRPRFQVEVQHPALTGTRAGCRTSDWKRGTISSRASSRGFRTQ